MVPASKGDLPRLAPEHYRPTGWLTPAFHHAWQLTLLHACARYHFFDTLNRFGKSPKRRSSTK